MNPAKKLFAHYTAYHAHGPLLLRYMSLVGFIGFPAFYLLRFTKSASVYDDLNFRLFDAAICFILFLKARWPERLKPYYFAYSYAVVLILFPLTFVFTSLKHGGGTIAVGNTLLAAFMVVFLADWRNTFVILLTGFAAAVGLYVLTDPDPRMPVDYAQRLPILFIVMACGSLFKFALERATAERVRHAYASLAGSIAHEMRNPLGQIKHSLESMRQSLPLPTTKATTQVMSHEEVNALYRHLAQGDIAVERGLQVISMTLDEVNAKPLNPVGFAYLSAADACNKAVLEYGYESHEQRSRVDIEVRQDFLFRGEETAFLFVLFNLIKNALYYLPAYPQSRLVITVDGGKVTVCDNGPGITPELQRRLFEPFRSSKSGGTGLGLAYCRRVMRAFSGDISCQSVPGQYTRFTMSFPPVTSQEREAYRQAVIDKAKAVFVRRRLLVVDDDAALRKATRTKLAPVDAVIDEASDGRQALAMLSNFRYDLVVLDLDMPGMDGYAIADQIRSGQTPGNRDVCIVAYTSEPGPLARVKTLKAGMDGLVSKPCEQETLLSALCRALESPAGRARLEQAHLAGQRVLLADDNAYNRKAVAAYLRHVGVEVSEADTGQAVLQQLEAGGGSWDAVLLDINMPGMSGLDTARAIRASNRPFREVPIVALTAHSGAEMMVEARAAGMGDFITKPVDAAVLYGKLRQLRSRQPALPEAPAAVAQVDERLLDIVRLERYRDIGMLEELVGDYLPEIARIVERLERSAAQLELEACLELLHSLVGLSGEAGAGALHRLSKRIYVQMSQDRRLPGEAHWVEPISALAAQSTRALKEYGSSGAAVP